MDAFLDEASGKNINSINSNKLSLNLADPGDGGGGPTPTVCDNLAYYLCLGVCVATIEAPPVAAACAVVCYCSFCKGPIRDDTCR